MTCRRICRELLWQARFGELGPGSTPHLEHLSECRSCRDELGFDRALVRQLRTALAARIEGAAPSPRAWEGILARMTSPEPAPSRLRAWSTALVARLRVGSAMAGASLAILLALNVQVVPVRPSDATAPVEPPPAAAPDRPLRLADGFSQGGGSVLAVVEREVVEPAEDPRPVVVFGAQEPEQLPLPGGRPAATSNADEEPVTSAEPTEPQPAEPAPLSVRLVPADAAVFRAAPPEDTTEDDAGEEPAPASTPQPSGAPS